MEEEGFEPPINLEFILIFKINALNLSAILFFYFTLYIKKKSFQKNWKC